MKAPDDQFSDRIQAALHTNNPGDRSDDLFTGRVMAAIAQERRRKRMARAARSIFGTLAAICAHHSLGSPPLWSQFSEAIFASTQRTLPIANRLITASPWEWVVAAGAVAFLILWVDQQRTWRAD